MISWSEAESADLVTSVSFSEKTMSIDEQMTDLKDNFDVAAISATEVLNISVTPPMISFIDELFEEDFREGSNEEMPSSFAQDDVERECPNHRHSYCQISDCKSSWYHSDEEEFEEKGSFYKDHVPLDTPLCPHLRKRLVNGEKRLIYFDFCDCGK